MKTYLIGVLCASALGVTALPASACEAHEAGHTNSHAAAPAAAGASVTLGDLTLSGGFSRATPPRAPVAGGFLTIANAGAADRLVSASAEEIAGRTEIHEMQMQGDVMRMRELPDGLPIPAGASVELRPGGLHIMFRELKRPLTEGETIKLMLVFEKAGEVELPLLVGPLNARPSGAGKGGSDVGN
ncbi:hypothetical protein SAMN04487972_11720 [Paracoccus halophilus]|uniref:Copper chaperone PCu(A)C n=1 Tax=Paracoccus halophilus TaxID=376733 RepID=A0A1I0TZP8_9RHOB|nr:copper chaperone PCu(A)C [Paracoccus halophilus]SFA57255.1 hypothetical protein SAMN04487972_11720 [Paracoccus halophilus]